MHMTDAEAILKWHCHCINTIRTSQMLYANVSNNRYTFAILGNTSELNMYMILHSIIKKIQ